LLCYVRNDKGKMRDCHAQPNGLSLAITRFETVIASLAESEARNPVILRKNYEKCSRSFSPRNICHRHRQPLSVVGCRLLVSKR